MEENKIYRTDDFAVELMNLDPRISVIPNPNREKISNIKIDGQDVCPIPRYEIREHRDAGYTIEMPNGSLVPHKSRTEALDLVKHTLKLIENPENSDAFFGRNGY